jgi:hypothetical protein
MKRIGIEPGKSFDIEKASPAVRTALEAAPAMVQKLMEWKTPTIARVANHWSMNTDTMGVYGNCYLKRAIIAQSVLGANVPEDAIYPMSLGDQAGRPLDGANKYALHFDKGAVGMPRPIQRQRWVGVGLPRRSTLDCFARPPRRCPRRLA